jgi:acyl carrier protein
MKKEEIKIRIKDFIRENTFAEIQNIQDSTMLFDDGVFDSMGLVLLISFLEEEFDIHTDDTDLIVENFESIEAISKFILNRK